MLLLLVLFLARSLCFGGLREAKWAGHADAVIRASDTAAVRTLAPCSALGRLWAGLETLTQQQQQVQLWQ
jgi:hypothetical protein